MCSQAHNDAEDLLNEIFVRIANDPQIEDRMSKENVFFARNLTYRAAEFMLQAGIDYRRRPTEWIRARRLALPPWIVFGIASCSSSTGSTSLRRRDEPARASEK